MSRRHVIVGGAGFVGARLAATLQAQGERVLVFDEAAAAPGFEAVTGDIRQPDALARLSLGPDDLVYHLAARQFHGRVPRRSRDAWFDDVNVGGTRNLLRAMQRGGALRLVFLSTDMTYGVPRQTPVPATHVQRPIGPYGRSKVAAERLIDAAGQEFGLRATVFRPRLIAGAGRLGILATLFRLIARNLPVPLIGAGRNRYQMIAVDDCVAAMRRAVDKGLPGGPFNLGSANPPTVRELLSGLIARAGSRSMLVPTPAPLVQGVLTALDRTGLPLLYPEQFAIADVDYVLDTQATRTALDWAPLRQDGDILFDAYQHCVASRSPAPSDPAVGANRASEAGA